jgi:hypothetical protein
MLDPQPDTWHVRKRFLERLNHPDRTMAATRASDRHGQVALPLLDVLRQCKSQEGRQVIEELSRDRVPAHVSRDRRVTTRQEPQTSDEMRVW